MSLNYLYDFVIHYHTYKNIDLLNQGLYQIKSKIYTIYNNKKHFAVPYYYVDSKALEYMYQTEEQGVKPHCIINSNVDENNNYEYISKSFIIRYADEEVELDEFCYFKIEVPQEIVKKNNLNFICEFQICFSDAINSISKEIKNGNYQYLKFNFKKEQTEQVVITNNNFSDNFVEMYSPIVFHENFSSILSISIHKILSDFKMRINNDLIPFDLEEIEEESNDNNNNNNNNNDKEKKVNNLNNNNNININKKEITSLIDFLLEEKDITPKISPNLIDKLYNTYIFSLINSYLTLKNRLNQMTLKLIDENMKAEYSTFLNNQPLIIYNEEKEEQIQIQNEDNQRNIFDKIKNLSQRINDTNKDYVGYRIFKEINFINSQIEYIWHKYIELIRNFPGPFNFIMQMEFRKNLKDDLNKFLKKNIVNIIDTKNMLIPIEENLQEHNNKLAMEIRENLIKIYKKPIFENSSFKIIPELYPILFEETYIKNLSQNIDKNSLLDNNNYSNSKNIATNNNNNNNNLNNINNNIKTNSVLTSYTESSLSDYKTDNTLGLHLIILVHGFEGNSNDMRVIKNEIALINPSIVFLPSTINQDNTGLDLIQMGKKLANEVKNYIKEWNDGLIFKKISFIGHSIGGVIIRSALPHLAEFKDKLWMYISLGSPHLGHSYSDSFLIKTGIWVLKKWKGSICLEQLLQNDNSNLNETCIYKLSEFEGLNWFKNVFLLSSHQDNYSPYESSRIQLSDVTLKNDKRADCYRRMAYNILSKITNSNLKRVDINFVIQEKNFDTFIGRTAHIQFLENSDFMKIFFNSIEDLLK